MTITLGPKADLVFGRTGSTKTTQVGHMAEYIMEKYGQKTRLVSADPGGWISIEHLCSAGIIDPVQINLQTPFPLEAITRYSMGWWPDAHGKLVKAEVPKDVGAYAFEGLSTFSILIMSNLVSRKDIHIPDTPKESWVDDKLEGGGMHWGFSGRAHYGFIQQRMYEIVTNSNHLPVHKVLWTAHETDAKDNQKRAIMGPQIIGEAMTGQCGAWFGAMLHMFPVEKSVQADDPIDKGKKISISRYVPIMFLRDHIDPKDTYKIPFMAKPRGPSSLWQEWPDYMEPNIGNFYKKLDTMAQKALDEIRAKQEAKRAKGG